MKMNLQFFVQASILLFISITNLLAAKSEIQWRYQRFVNEYDTMSVKRYVLVLEHAQKSENNAKELIAQEQALIEGYKQRIAEYETKIAQTILETYAILGTTKQDIEIVRGACNDLKRRIEDLLCMPPAELLNRLQEIKQCETDIARVEEKPAAQVWSIRDVIDECKRLLAQLKSRIPIQKEPERVTEYVVRQNPQRTDCLYRIAEYSTVYNDPLQWPKLYRANKSMIDKGFEEYRKNTRNPKYFRPQDLIFPGQVFQIPR